MAGLERSIEIKVGLLMLVSLLILGGVVAVIAGLSFQPTYQLYVEFDNPGGLQTGAPVRIAGVKVGKVSELAFKPGMVDPATHRHTLVRATVLIEKRVESTLHEDADFYVTTQGVLGEQFLSIDPGLPDKPVLREGALVKGIDPPRLDLFIAKAYELLDTTVNGLSTNRELISDIAVNAGGVLKNLHVIMEANRDRITRILANVEELTSETTTLVRETRQNYVENPKVARTLENVDKLMADLARETPALLRDAREATANLNRLTAAVGSTEQTQKLQKAIDQVVELVGRTNATVADTQVIVAHIKKGQGTVGALVMDEEMFDELQAMARDLKRNPWKFFWKE